jgi:peptidyl-prolyl cis-trans isomerase C
MDFSKRPGGLAPLIGLLFVFIFSIACASTTASPAAPSATPVSENVATTPPEPSATAAPPSPTAEPPLAARVNGQPIYLADYERELARYEASLSAQGIDPNSQEGQEELAQAKDWILNVMIEQVLTEQAAEKAGVTVSEEEVNAYMQAMIDENGGEEAFRAKLEKWGETYDDAKREVHAQLVGMAMTERVIESVPTTAKHIHARHILVDTQQEAESIQAQLEAGADFTALAKAHSQDASTRESGGDLGFFPRGILVAPEVEETAFALQPGQFSEVVSSSLGYHIVQVVEQDPERPIGPENLRLLQDQAVQRWIESLWARAEVERFVDAAP